jgi:hypothetical protein
MGWLELKPPTLKPLDESGKLGLPHVRSPTHVPDKSH